MCKALTPGEARKHSKGICIAALCSNRPKPVKRKRGKYVPLLCAACARRSWALRNPEKYLYANLRGNARRRGKYFGITFPEFCEFLKREGYLDKIRGRTKYSVSIDRIENELGYILANMRTLSISANSEKRHYVDYFRRMEENYHANEKNIAGVD
jgi:hypothetical protein